MTKIYTLTNLDKLKDDLIANNFTVQVVDCLDRYDIKVLKYTENYTICLLSALNTKNIKDIVLSDKCLIDDYIEIKPRRKTT